MQQGRLGLRQAAGRGNPPGTGRAPGVSPAAPSWPGPLGGTASESQAVSDQPCRSSTWPSPCQSRWHRLSPKSSPGHVQKERSGRRKIPSLGPLLRSCTAGKLSEAPSAFHSGASRRWPVINEDKGDFNEEVTQDGVRVLIKKKAQRTLLGTEIVYAEDKLSSEFVFNNPNIKGTCGHGESFTI
uniref:Iron-sulfur cluster assembly 1 homolog, mitochondrial n=2 Tax=Macaca TaxID=9539 RepID=A0A7N9DDI8_MACFA